MPTPSANGIKSRPCRVTDGNNPPNVQQAPQNGIYADPLFGWVELENVGGTIELLNGAIEYQGGEIYAGTQTIIPVPEPSALGLVALGAIFLGGHRGRQFKRWPTGFVLIVFNDLPARRLACFMATTCACDRRPLAGQSFNADGQGPCAL